MGSALYRAAQGLLGKQEDEQQLREETFFERTQRLLRGETPLSLRETTIDGVPIVAEELLAPTDVSLMPVQRAGGATGASGAKEFIIWRDEPFFQELRQHPTFRELMRVQSLAAESLKDPSVGDANTYFTQIEDLIDQILNETGLSEHEEGKNIFNEFVRYETTGQVGSTDITRRAMNLLGSFAGILEPLALPGDFARTFIAALAEQQAKRVNEDYERNLKTGTAVGSPATNPLMAANDMAQALIATFQQMGGGELPWTKDADGNVVLNEDSAWIMYLPSIIWDGKKLWGSTPYEGDRAVSGVELNERFGWFNNCEDSDNPQLCKQLMGMATEAMLDPVLWADIVFLAAGSVRLGSKLLPSEVAAAAARSTDNLGSLAIDLPYAPVVTSESATQLATFLENAATSIYRNTTFYGAAGRAIKLLEKLPFSPLRATLNTMNRVINRMLDAEAPGVFLPRGTREAAGAFGWTAPGPTTRPTSAVPTEGFRDAPFRPTWRDVLLQQGRGAYLSENSPNYLLGSPETGLSAAEISVGRDYTLRNIAARGASEMQSALTEGLTDKKLFRLPWTRTVLPDARVIKPEYQNYVDMLGGIVSDVIENVGVMRSWRDDPKIVGRVNRLTKLYDIPFDDTARRLDNAVTAGNKVTLQTGYHVSGYDDFVVALNNSVETGINNKLLPENVTPGDVRRALELRVGNIDLQEMELAQNIVMVRPEVTKATFATEASQEAVQRILDFWNTNPNQYTLWSELVANNLQAAGRSDLAAFTPEQYLRGLSEGYMRREFEVVNNLEAVRHALANRDLIVMRNLRFDSSKNPVGRAFGSEAGAAFSNYIEIITPPRPRNVIEQKRAVEAAAHQTLAASPEDAAFLREWFEETGTMKTTPYTRATHFRADHAAEAINRQTGLSLTAEDVADVIWENSTSYKYLKRTIDLMTERSGRVSGAGGLTTPWSQTPTVFAERELFDLPALAQLVMVRDPVALTGAAGMRAGRQVRAKSFLQDAFDFLSEQGLIRDPSEIGLRGQSVPTDTIFPFQMGDGTKYVSLPDKPELWGPLAGQAIPESIARTFVYAQRYGMTDASSMQRLFNMWRQALLMPLPTSLRNVISNYLQIWQAGGNFSSLMANTPKAHKLNANFAQNGILPDEFKGYEHLFSWISSSTLTGSINEPLEKYLRRVVSNQQNTVNALEQAEDFMSWVTQTPPIGFLGFFKWGEEVSRSAAFLSSYDDLIRTGISKSEAINRAAHFAVNSAHNYGMAPLLPETLKRSYLSAFPQFNYFMISRNLRTAIENPATLQKPEYVRRAVNIWATEGDLEEQERVTALMADWERYSYPLVIPIPGKNGEYYNVNMGFFFPTQTGVGPQVFLDPFTGVALAPAIDAGIAWINNNGKGFFGTRFGQEVFDPSAPVGEQLLQTAGFLGGSYFLPRLLGPNGSLPQLMEAAAYNENKELFDLIGLAQGKHYNLDWAQVFARNIGFNARKVNVLTSGVNLQQREREIITHYGLKISRVEKQIQELSLAATKAQGAELTRISNELNELYTRSERLNMDKTRDLMQLYKMVR